MDNFILLFPLLLIFQGEGDFAGVIAGIVALLAVRATYFVKLLASPDGQTIDRRVVGTRVKDALTGQALSMQQSFKRWTLLALYAVFELFNNDALTFAVVVISFIDCLYPLFNERKQTLHDQFAGTIVVRS